MKFKELLNRYKNGTVTEEERILVEKEIEKYEAIEDYIAENFDIDFIALEKNDNQKEETIKIKKSVNNRLKKVVLTSVAIVLIIILGVFFIVSPIMDSFYYNPTKVSIGENLKDIYFDLTAYTELNLPGYDTGFVGTESLGFGKYDINLNCRNLFTQEKSNISAKINRDKYIKNYDDEYYFFFGFEAIMNPELFESQYFNDQKKRVMNHIKKLNSVSYVSAYLTFQEDLTMEEFYEMSTEYSDIKFTWVGIRTSPQDEVVQYLTGFSPYANTVSMAADRPNKDKYPAFQLIDWLKGNTKSRSYSIWPKGYELHYKSLLRYMVDRKEAVKVLEYTPVKSQYYQSALDYVEKQGVKTYGVLVYANAEDLIKFVENESIKTIEMDQVMASKRYIN